MVEIRESVSIREPLAAEFETVIHNLRPLPAQFLLDVISAMELFAASEQCTLVLQSADTGSISLRWKIMIGAIFSAQTLSLAADGAQVSDFMARLWQNATQQEAGQPSTRLGKTICQAIEDGDIESITLSQKGGEARQIDARTYKPGNFVDDVGNVGIVMGEGWVTKVYAEKDFSDLDQDIIGTVFVIEGKPYFQTSARGPIFPIIDKRYLVEEWANGKKYILTAHMHEFRFGKTAWIVSGASLA